MARTKTCKLPMPTRHTRKYRKTTDEKRYVIPCVYVEKGSEFDRAFRFRNMSDEFFTQYPPLVLNSALEGKEFYDACKAAGIDVFYEPEDNSPAAFKHGPYTDGIGRPWDWAYSDTMYRISDEFRNDPNAPELRGMHDYDEQRFVQEKFDATATEDLHSKDWESDDSCDKHDYPGAVKVDPSLGGKPKKKKKKKKKKRAVTPPPAPIEKARVTMPKSRTSGFENNVLRVQNGDARRGRPIKNAALVAEGQSAKSSTADGSGGISQPSHGAEGKDPHALERGRKNSGNADGSGDTSQKACEGRLPRPSASPSRHRTTSHQMVGDRPLSTPSTPQTAKQGPRAKNSPDKPKAENDARCKDGFDDNAERENAGKKKRGCPPGRKNDKTLQKEAQAALAKANNAGGSSLEAGQGSDKGQDGGLALSGKTADYANTEVAGDSPHEVEQECEQNSIDGLALDDAKPNPVDAEGSEPDAAFEWDDGYGY